MILAPLTGIIFLSFIDHQESITRLEENYKTSKAGLVLSLGTGDTGQLGLGEDILERSKPALVKGVEGQIVSIAAGGMHTVCLTKDGLVWSFGCNDEGALGRPIEDDEEGTYAKYHNNQMLI